MKIFAERALSWQWRFVRFWLPCMILALGALAVDLVWAWPAESWDRGNRVMATWSAIALAGLLLMLWFLFFAGLRWQVRVGLWLGLIVACFAAIRDVTFTGDMVPIVHFRWNRTHDDILEAFNRQQANEPPPASIDLSQAATTDFPEYRGRKRDGVVNGPPLARDWKAQPPRLLWRRPVGGGYSSCAVVGNALVTLEQRRDQEAVVCYDTATGKQRWVYTYPAHFTERLGGPGPRATPTIAGSDVFSLGATGMLVCLEVATGKLKWSVNILENNDNLQWGMSGSPLVYDDVVVVNPGAQRKTASGQALVAYERTTGRKVWSAGSAQAGYSSPMLATLCGRQQILLFDGEGLAGYDPKAHRELWRYAWTTMQGINVAQPLVLEGNRVFISSGYTVGCAMLQIKEDRGQWSAEPVWGQTPNKLMRCKFASPVAYQACIYGLDDGVLVCLDQKTGGQHWRGKRYGHGQLLRAGDLLLILSERGHLALVEASPEAFSELGSISVFNEQKTWNSPALADGKAYLRNDQEMACYDLAEVRSK